MGRGIAVRNERQGRSALAITASVGQRTTLPPYQTRMCAAVRTPDDVRARGPGRRMVHVRRVRPLRLTRLHHAQSPA
jgi:hypothetical protein